MTDYLKEYQERTPGVRPALCPGRPGHAGRDLPQPALLPALPALYQESGRLQDLGRRRQRVHRPLDGPLRSYPRSPARTGHEGAEGNIRRRRPLGHRQRIPGRLRGGPLPHRPLRREGPVRRLRYGGDDVRRPAGAGLHRQEGDSQGPGRLARVRHRLERGRPCPHGHPGECGPSAGRGGVHPDGFVQRSGRNPRRHSTKRLRSGGGHPGSGGAVLHGAG